MKALKKILILTLACVLILTSVMGCSSSGKTMIELEDSEISVNLFMLMLSRMKGSLSSSYSFGAQALKDSFWDTVMNASTGMTYNEYYTNMVLDNAKTYIAALSLFEELDLKLPDSYIDEIDSELDELVKNDGKGSKSTLNSILAEFGANYKVLRDAYIMEAKIAYLNDHLFGSDGSKIAEELKQEYYKENYVRFRQIFFFTTKPVYQTDVNGDEIYYTSDGKIAYDKENGIKKEENGAVVKDKNGDIVFVKYDEAGKEHIAYDKGTKDSPNTRNPVLDENGNVVTTKLSASEHIALQDKATLIIENEAVTGDYTLFDSLVDKYGEDEGMDQYPNGYYFTETSDYDSPEVVDALFEMSDGEIRKVSSEYGIHIIMKYKLDDGGYSNEENADFFTSFTSSLKNVLFAQYLEKYKESIVVDEELLSTVSMKSVGANYNY